MSEIRFFALGGLGENGKNMYVVDVDRQYFILDAGLKYPTQELYGVDEIIPNYKMLINIKNRIKGIFLTHAHEDHIGALPHILNELNVPVYATPFTMEVVKDSLIEKNYDLSKLTLHTIDSNTIIRSGNVKVTFFSTTHSIPESIGIAIHTIDGVIVYTSDFTFVQNKDPNYQTDFKKINELAQKKVIALLLESLGSTLIQDGGIHDALTHKINSVYANAEGRIIVSLFSSDLLKIQRIIDISLIHHKKIAIIGRKAQRIVDIAIEKGYLQIPSDALTTLRYIDDKNKNDSKDLVCLVTGNRHEPFFMLQRMCKKQDRLIHINDKDTILIMTPPVPGTEKMAARTLDVLYRSDATVKQIPNRLLTSSHATSEEIKMMINLLSPQYIIPTIGEYRHQYGVKQIAESIGYQEDKIIILDNGDVAFFKEGELSYTSKGDIKTGDILIDGTAIGDVNQFVMRDREMLADDGVLLIIANIDPKKKKVLGDVEIVSRGFVYVQEAQEVINELKNIFFTTVDKHLKGKYINWNDLKQDIKEESTKYIQQVTKRKPITIPVIISTETDSK
ncbi:MAG TPA: ribonuclease J [Acholeplasma sp.]|nr:ribonuclease J [Acholeplasma sp.]